MPRLDLAGVLEHSNFVRRALRAMYPMEEDDARLAHLAALVEEGRTRADFERAVEGEDDTERLAETLRRVRRELILYLVAADSTGAIDYFGVVERMSDFAEVAVRSTVRAHARELARRHGVPFGAVTGTPQDLIVVGMGKLGGRELNVSSDIDLIFLYDEDGETRPTPEFPDARRTLTVTEFYERLARRVLPALNDIRGAGFVFRVDMRLRPNGDSGPIVGSSDMLEEYLYTQGRDWERFAWLKGRVVSAPVFSSPEEFERASHAVENLVRPFVFRKYLDFGAISSLTKLHETLRAETARREAQRNFTGANVKLGRGGIREIEFLTQTLQVIRGGRDVRLRGKETLPMLTRLGEEGVLSPEVAEKLKEDYVWLRNVEHALQYVDDQQTQLLPREGENLVHAAALLGVTPEELWAHYEAVRDRVGRAFENVFQVKDTPEGAESDWPVGWQTGTSSARTALEEMFVRKGYAAEDAPELAQRTANLAMGRFSAFKSEGALQKMQQLLQMVVANIPQWVKSDAVRVVAPSELLSRYLRLLEAVAGRTTYVTLLCQYPRAAERVGRVLAASRWSTDFVASHPIILDELVDGRIREMDDFTPVDWSEWRERFREALAECGDDQERQMNLLRDAYHSAVFRLLIADIDGRFTVERLADQLSALADAVIEETLEIVWRAMAQKHCERPKFAVLGYGKLGGKELGYESDLDLVFLYDDPSDEADRTYSRLVRRMISWLTVPTSSGKLFDIDLRLRPNGENGLVVSTMAHFENYQKRSDGVGAWIWEHQALTRARFVAGDPAIGRRFEALREEVLRMPRDLAALKEAVLEMRERMHEGHRNPTKLFDVKHDAGGMVDVEFIVQTLVLGYSHDHSQLVNNFGNILLLEMAADAGLIPAELTAKVVKAYRRYRALQHEIRLNAGEARAVRVDPALVADEAEAVRELWRVFFGR